MTQHNTHTTEPTLFDNLDFIQRIDELIANMESNEVEFKSGKGGLPGSLWETYSAFANSQGGVIIVGVTESDNGFNVGNLTKSDVDKLKKLFWDNVNNKQKVSTNHLVDRDVTDAEYNGSYILIINVPRADRSQIPVYINGNFDNTYKRNYEGDYKCDTNEVRRMVADSDVYQSRDSRILEGFTIENDIDTETLKQYRNRFNVLHISHPWSNLNDKEFLIHLGGYRLDRKTKAEGLTLAGMLMFGKYLSIADNDCCPAYFPDYRVYADNNPNARWSDRVHYDGTWEPNLYQFYIKVYNRLASVLPKPFALKDGVRIDESPTHEALREAFFNTLIHCDYAASSNIVITQHNDKYIFSNPGSLLVSLEQYYRGGESECRNKSLQKMFMFIGGSEQAGSGVEKILQGWKLAHFRQPAVTERSKPEKVELTLPLVSLLSDEVVAGLKSLFGEDVVDIEHNKLMILAFCYSDKSTSNNRLQSLLMLHRADITAILQEMCHEEYLISDGVGRGTKYYLNINYLYLESKNLESINLASKNLASSKRYASQKLQDQIVAICNEFQSAQYIAQQVDRNVRYIKNEVIAKMVSQELLEREFPDTPRHPKQRYRAKL